MGGGVSEDNCKYDHFTFSLQNIPKRVNSGFHRGVNEVFAVAGCYVGLNGSQLPDFLESLTHIHGTDRLYRNVSNSIPINAA